MTDLLNPDQSLQHEPTLKEQYILQECSQLRDEIWVRVKDQRLTERYVLIACAVIYSFASISRTAHAASPEIQFLCAWAWYVPPVLSLLALARWRESVHLICQIADYTREREKEVLGSKGGWETYLANSGRKLSVLSSGYYIAFWLFLIASTTALAVYQEPLVTTWKLPAALLTGLLAAIATFGVIADTPRSMKMGTIASQ